jgi:toxin-antitoxin system PIN domain toxin
MIAVDTNILVHAHRSDSPWNETAIGRLQALAEGPWAIPWPCIHEFIAIVTHPRIFDPPTPAERALEAVGTWMSAPTLELLSEAGGYWDVLSDLLGTSRVTGPRVHDARIAAICVQHAVTEIWTADRDFSRFPGVHAVNPLVISSP